MGGSPLVVAACVGVACVIFYIQLRHWIFVVLALLPPVTVLASAAFLRPHSLDWAFIASLFGTMCALSLGDRMVRGVSAGLRGRERASEASRFVTFAVGPVLAAYLVLLGVSAVVLHAWDAYTAVAFLFLAGFAAAFAGAWLCAFYPFSEQFIARANAAREWRERMLEQFFPAMQPRWALSVTGIAIVLGAVAVFGIRDAHVHWMMGVAFCFAGSVAFALAGFAVVARDWRMAAALTLATAFTGTLLFWALIRHNPFPDFFMAVAMLMVSSVPLSVTAARARQLVREGDDIASALAAAGRGEGAVAVALCLVAGSAGLLASAASATLSPALVFAVSSTFSALLLFPALAIAIQTLLPRYRTVDEVYGRR
jgi:hypothetical protein